jgi:hypothetical protein
VCLGVGVVPNVEILDVLGCRLTYRPGLGGHVPVTDQALRTSRPDVHVAGDCAGVTPAKSRDPGLAAAEGRLTGAQAAASLGAAPRAAPALPVPSKAHDIGPEAPLEAWVRAVQTTAPEDLVICQCEEVTCGDLVRVRPPRYLGAASPGFARRSLDPLLAGGPLNQDPVKRLTRVGMGACQERRCREQVAALLALAARVPPDVPPLPTYRPRLRPTPLSVLQDEREPGLPPLKWSTPHVGFGRVGGPFDAAQEEARP